MPNWVYVDGAKEQLMNELDVGVMTSGIGVQPFFKDPVPTITTAVAAITAGLANAAPTQFQLGAAATVNGVTKRESVGDVTITNATGDTFAWTGLALLRKDNNDVWTPIAYGIANDPSEIWAIGAEKKFTVSITLESKNQ